MTNDLNFISPKQHPFLINLEWFGKDDSFLYMMFPFQSGGELFSYLRTTGRFSINTAQFYTVEIVSALDYLHAQSIVYRDLKVLLYFTHSRPTEYSNLYFRSRRISYWTRRATSASPTLVSRNASATERGPCAARRSISRPRSSRARATASPSTGGHLEYSSTK